MIYYRRLPFKVAEQRAHDISRTMSLRKARPRALDKI